MSLSDNEAEALAVLPHAKAVMDAALDAAREDEAITDEDDLYGVDVSEVRASVFTVTQDATDEAAVRSEHATLSGATYGTREGSRAIRVTAPPAAWADFARREWSRNGRPVQVCSTVW